MLAFLLLLTTIHTRLSQQFNVYDMRNSQDVLMTQQFFYDCLNYYADESFNKLENMQYKLVHQTILYCFRPSEKLTHETLHSTNSRISNFTFDQLRRRNVTIYQLYSWLAPIDLLESYQFYLDTNILTSDLLFYNCTRPRFGPFCQYSFDLDDEHWSFTDIVKKTFDIKTSRNYWNLEPSKTLTNLSCYTYLECDRGGPFPACLDWHEICYGKVQCVSNGADEKFCDELEINECQKNEYRCHNGQCIPEDFFHDDNRHPDCLDASDEPFQSSDYQNCANDPAFRCEDHMCWPHDFIGLTACGDGQCFIGRCTNKRDLLLEQALIKSTVDVSGECRDAMACFTGLQDCKTETNITKSCPPLFQFPGAPIIFGHVKFLYRNTIPNSNLLGGTLLLPTYICYDAELCSVGPTQRVGNYSDCLRYEIPQVRQSQMTSWGYIQFSLAELFVHCAVVPGGYCHHDTLFSCNTTKPKCISKHRLVDGFRDCLYADDEQYQESCLLNNSKNRLQCDGKCFSPIVLQNGNSDCRDAKDEVISYDEYVRTHISFQAICDGFTELVPVDVDGELYTDETECHLWPCNNTYTRCDGIWNCFDGADEVNCIVSNCSSLEHPCLSWVNNNLICLPIEKAGNNIMDCLGGLDEPQLCRTGTSYYDSGRFFCGYAEGYCLSEEFLCNGRAECIEGDDERFCKSTSRLCKNDDQYNNEIERIMCSLLNTKKRRIVHLSVRNSYEYPNQALSTSKNIEQMSVKHNHAVQKIVKSELDNEESSSIVWAWRCNRGLNVRVWAGDGEYKQKCLCPPNYYGDLCEYQNQRVSVILEVKTLAELRTLFVIVIILIDDEQNIHSHDQIEYLAIRDCNTKFYVNLLYLMRPKTPSKNYSIRIDAFNQRSLEHRASWLFPIVFPFLPVHRMTLQIIIPIKIASSCSLDCGKNGQCLIYHNTHTPFCRCQSNWAGSQCNDRYKCNCSPSSSCIGPSMCLCTITKFGPRCYLTRPNCKADSCTENSLCVPADIRISEINVYCLCKNGFSGEKCDKKSTKIDIQFREVPPPLHIFIHFIEVFEREINKTKLQSNGAYREVDIEGGAQVRAHVRTSTVMKIGLYYNSISIDRSAPFHLVFAEFDNSIYSAVVQEKFIPSSVISTDINSSRRCQSANGLFNTTLLKLHPLRRLKYYHTFCQQKLDLVCFYDGIYMCLCNLFRHANCFEFNSTMRYDCQGMNYCEHGAQCFLDDPKCPGTSLCSCPPCYYGSRCQFSTKNDGISLESILGYHIQPNITLTSQPLVVTVSAISTMMMFSIGVVSSLLSILTFQTKKSREVGCGIYLLASSFTSLFTMIVFTIKFWLVVLSHMARITSPTYLRFNCSSIDFLLQTCLGTGDWLNACVAIERIGIVVQGVNFNKLTSKRIAKWVPIFLLLFVLGTSIQQVIYHRLIYDEEEERFWCIAEYPALVDRFNSAILLTHFLTPFLINVISALTIIIMAVRQRSTVLQNISYWQQMREQLIKHKHLLISPVILVVLALPRIIIALLAGCIKPYRDPWLFLAAYTVSFISPVLVFPIFIMPSKSHKKAFKEAMKRLHQRLNCR